ncbi:MAG: branched-chain amino acid ABC transporter permease [Pseudomonadota bacterium]
MRFVFKTDYNQDLGLFKHAQHRMWYLLLGALSVALPWLISDYLLGEITLVLIWSIASMGLMILIGQTGLASLGHAAFLAIGAYSVVLLQERLGLPFLLAFPLAGLISGLCGAAIARPIAKLHGVYLAIATLALGILVEDIIVIAEPLTGGVGGLFAPDIEIFGHTFNKYINPSDVYFLILAITVALVWFYKNLLRSPLGRAFAAIRDSEVSAQAMGVELAKTKAMSFALSAAYTGLAGALLGHFTGIFNNETFTIIISINMLMMIVIGGVGSIHGAFFGAAVFVLLPTVIAFARDGLATLGFGNAVVIPGIEAGIFAMILIGFLLFEPLGIYGRWVKIRTWFELFPLARRDMFKRNQSFLKTERTR